MSFHQYFRQTSANFRLCVFFERFPSRAPKCSPNGDGPLEARKGHWPQMGPTRQFHFRQTSTNFRHLPANQFGIWGWGPNGPLKWNPFGSRKIHVQNTVESEVVGSLSEVWSEVKNNYVAQSCFCL